jgi:NAD+ diphosphatase
MRISETVTFGGSGLDRAGQSRADAAAMARLLADPRARVVPVWRGKPLIAAAARDVLGWLPADHPVLALAGDARLFLGHDEAGPRFAADISAWTPPDLDAAALAAFHDPTEQRHPDLPPDHLFAELRGVMTRLSARDAEFAATARALAGWHVSHRYCSNCGAQSALAEAGWRRTCAECGTHHFPRSDPVVIMLVTRGNSVLLGRSPGWPQGMYSLLAGFVEPGESMEAAVRREVAEETGVIVGSVGYLASQPWPFPSSLMLGCRAEALSEAITIDPAELEDARWITREDMADIMAGANPEVRGARAGSIAHFLIRHWLADRLD